MRGAELFAGCGGLALGMSRAGVHHALMAEWDGDAVATVHHNRTRGVSHVSSWPIERTDVRSIDWSAHGAVASRTVRSARGMSVKAMRRSRNAATATSLAPFSATGA